MSAPSNELHTNRRHILGVFSDEKPMNHDWEVSVREIWPLSGRPWVAVWAELLRGEHIAKGDYFVAQTSTGQVDGVIQGIELHQPLHAPESWVGLLIGKHAVGTGDRITGRHVSRSN